MYYQQCKVQQNGSTIVTWLDERGAKVGNSVELIGEDGLWEVMKIGSHKLTHEAMREAERFHASHRKGTDI